MGRTRQLRTLPVIFVKDERDHMSPTVVNRACSPGFWTRSRKDTQQLKRVQLDHSEIRAFIDVIVNKIRERE